MTNDLADRDAVIGELVTNLNDVLETLGDRDDELSDLIGRCRRSSPASTTTEMRSSTRSTTSPIWPSRRRPADDARPDLTRDIRQLRRVVATLDDNRAEIDRALQILPIKLEKIGRTASYGSWFNFYLCNFTGRVKVPGPGGGT